MKNTAALICSILAGLCLSFICVGYYQKEYPNEYYHVYLDGNYLGTILSKEELETYIDAQTDHFINVEHVVKTYCQIDEEVQKVISESEEVKYYKNEQNQECADVTLKSGQQIEKVYTPNGLQIEKILTYSGQVDMVEDIYKKIVDLKTFTVKGYQFTLKDEDKSSYVYVLDKNVFEQAVKQLIETYVGKEEYNAYLQDSQLKIETVGSILENVYIQEEVTFKEKQIPISETIYTDYHKLAEFLLYGKDPKTKAYTVKEKEMITDIAFNNEISSQEFLISNPRYKDSNSLISAGTEVQIKETNPQLKVVIEKYVVEDQVNNYKTVYQYDDDHYIGYTETIQEGVDGLERVKQRIKIMNGVTVYVEPKGKETLKPSVDRIILKGEKFIPNVGDLSNWAWPTESGWTISDNYAWRFHPITGKRQFHNALDIAGTGYNSPVYAANNGTVIAKLETGGYGKHIIINHNNGYYTLYAHMNKFVNNIKVGDTVARGQQIGYVGSSGTATGPHLHFEVWKGCERCDISPWSLYQ